MRVAIMGSSAGVQNAHRMEAASLSAFHGGNLGNVAFVHALVRHLAGGDASAVVPWHAPAEVVRERADLVVIACANQLGSHADLGDHANHLKAIGLPVVAIGLGAQSASCDAAAEIRPGTRYWVDVIADHAPSTTPNIGVRGAYTLEQLERLGHGGQAVVTGCPSNLMDCSDVAARVSVRARRPVRRVACAVGQPHWPELAGVERAILDLVDATNGSCAVQHDDLMIRLGQAEFSRISDAELEQLRAYFRPELSDEAFALWSRRTMLAFGNASAWMAWLSRHDFVLGPRFHGVVLGLQAGIPVGCITHDSRTAEMCETMGVPSRPFSEMPERLTPEALPDLFPFDPDAYRRRRAKLASAYVGLLEGCGVPFDLALNLAAFPLRQQWALGA
ncbi:polysaccharide pyruvyl transferase family protein [Xanthobacter flavus]|uniref:polysaccharide pyruvyl transferase family protein n=1 Tax=Xanthobacter flavus TaxID=281 RepID=UPI00372C8B50